jgi:hypothetical protein
MWDICEGVNASRGGDTEGNVWPGVSGYILVLFFISMFAGNYTQLWGMLQTLLVCGMYTRVSFLSVCFRYYFRSNFSLPLMAVKICDVSVVYFYFPAFFHGH